jgi:hypothetical protein
VFILTDGAVVGAYFLLAIKVASQWEISTSTWIDLRIRLAEVKVESALRPGTVPVNVDAIIFWLVWNAEQATLDAMDFDHAISKAAQTALRESIGRHDLVQTITEPEMLGKEEQRILDEKRTLGGITYNRSRFATCTSRRLWETPCRVRRMRSGNGRRASYWHRGDRNLREVRHGCAGLCVEPGGPASACDEHAVLRDQGEGLHGDRAVVCGRDPNGEAGTAKRTILVVESDEAHIAGHAQSVAFQRLPCAIRDVVAGAEKSGQWDFRFDEILDRAQPFGERIVSELRGKGAGHDPGRLHRLSVSVVAVREPREAGIADEPDLAVSELLQASFAFGILTHCHPPAHCSAVIWSAVHRAIMATVHHAFSKPYAHRAAPRLLTNSRLADVYSSDERMN